MDITLGPTQPLQNQDGQATLWDTPRNKYPTLDEAHLREMMKSYSGYRASRTSDEIMNGTQSPFGSWGSSGQTANPALNGSPRKGVF